MASSSDAWQLSDVASGAVLACGTLLVERKLIRGAGCAGHVEDVVVDETARGRGVGKALLDALVAKAKALGCYKARASIVGDALGVGCGLTSAGVNGR